MKNELLIQTKEYAFKNTALTKQAEIIRKTSNQVLEGAMKIGKAFKEIKDKNLWNEDYKSFEQFADAVGYSKSTAYNLIKSYEVASKYKLEGFTAGQCLEIRTLEIAKGEKGVEAAIKSGKIAKNMTTKEIREAIKNEVKPEAKTEVKSEAKTEVTDLPEATEVTEATEKKDFATILTIEKMETENAVHYKVNGVAVGVSKVPAILEYLNKIEDIMNS